MLWSFEDDKRKQDEPVQIEAVIQQYKQMIAADWRTGAGTRLCGQRALESRLNRRESRTKECLPQTLSSSCTICSHAARRPRRAVMWSQCLGALCYCTPRCRTSQTVLPHQPSNYQQQECLFIPDAFPFPLPLLPAPGPPPALICHRSFTSAHRQLLPL